MPTTISNRVNTLLLVLLVLLAGAIIAILATRAAGGPLDPPGPPASTMHTLADTPPSWDHVLDATNGASGPTNPPAGCNSDRFKCVMTYQQCGGVCITVYPAVLDEETGLVWQRGPASGTIAWGGAETSCFQATTGERAGWRLPTEAELASLADNTDALPAGHPFAGTVTGTEFWSSDLQGNGAAWTYFFGPPLSVGPQSTLVGNLKPYWCVRGATSKE